MSIARGLISLVAGGCTVAFGGIFTYQLVYQGGRPSIIGSTLLVIALGAWIVLTILCARNTIIKALIRMVERIIENLESQQIANEVARLDTVMSPRRQPPHRRGIR